MLYKKLIQEENQRFSKKNGVLMYALCMRLKYHSSVWYFVFLL